MKTSLITLIIACQCFFLYGCHFLNDNATTITAPDIRRQPSTPYNVTKKIELQRINVDDRLSIKVFQVPDLSRTVRVDESGDITFPLIGKVHAQGYTPDELESIIAKRLDERYVRDPQVSVYVKNFVDQRITVQGVVRKPGIFPIRGKTTLMQAIALADGTDDAFSLSDLKQVHLYRSVENGKKDLYIYDLNSIYHGQISDPKVMNNDIIVVPKDPLRSRLKAIGDTIRSIVYFSVGTSIPIFPSY